jgi:DNA-binding MarR family transcriptional regulator
MLDRLGERNLIRRKINRRDRRVIDVQVTPRGKEVAERVGDVMGVLEAAISERVLPKDCDGFRKVMAAIAAVTQVELRPRKRADSESVVGSGDEPESGQS